MPNLPPLESLDFGDTLPDLSDPSYWLTQGSGKLAATFESTWGARLEQAANFAQIGYELAAATVAALSNPATGILGLALTAGSLLVNGLESRLEKSFRDNLHRKMAALDALQPAPVWECHAIGPLAPTFKDKVGGKVTKDSIRNQFAKGWVRGQGFRLNPDTPQPTQVGGGLVWLQEDPIWEYPYFIRASVPSFQAKRWDLDVASGAGAGTTNPWIPGQMLKRHKLPLGDLIPIFPYGTTELVDESVVRDPSEPSGSLVETLWEAFNDHRALLPLRGDLWRLWPVLTPAVLPWGGTLELSPQWMAVEAMMHGPTRALVLAPYDHIESKYRAWRLFLSKNLKTVSGALNPGEVGLDKLGIPIATNLAQQLPNYPGVSMRSARRLERSFRRYFALIQAITVNPAENLPLDAQYVWPDHPRSKEAVRNWEPARPLGFPDPSEDPDNPHPFWESGDVSETGKPLPTPPAPNQPKPEPEPEPEPAPVEPLPAEPAPLPAEPEPEPFEPLPAEPGPAPAEPEPFSFPTSTSSASSSGGGGGVAIVGLLILLALANR